MSAKQLIVAKKISGTPEILLWSESGAQIDSVRELGASGSGRRFNPSGGRLDFFRSRGINWSRLNVVKQRRYKGEEQKWQRNNQNQSNGGKRVNRLAASGHGCQRSCQAGKYD